MNKMERCIKFRGKRVDTGEWIYGDIIENQGRFFIYLSTSESTIEDNDNGSIVIRALEVEPGSGCQFVIKTPEDLNKFGKDGNYADFLEIYEGDIVEARCEFVYYDGYKGYSVKIGDQFVVTSYKAGYCAVPIYLYETWVEHGRIPNTCRVMNNYYLWNNHRFVKPIGNIVDSPDLIKNVGDEPSK